MKRCLFVFIFFACLTVFGQNEDKVWYFGPLGAGLDFRDCVPVVKTNGNNSTNSFEGAASICDATTGRLLFYASGAKIIDSTFNVMPNGINVGNGTSGTQSIILKRPGSNSIFYYFVTDIQGGVVPSYTPTAKGISYSIIDMTLNGGLGAVVSSHNPVKDTSNCEKLTAVKHTNGNDIWLIAHEYRTNNFLVYSITNSGINLTPSVYSVGPVITATQSTTYATSRIDAIGELKASPNGNRLAFTTSYNGITCLLDFNKSTGLISNPIQLSLNGFGGYGVSFSPDNQKLYISCLDTTNISQSVNGQIVQFDLTSGVPATIQSSKQIINSCANCSYRSIKLAPNGKIYCTKLPTFSESYTLAVINSPNNSGPACNYVHNGLYLNGLFSTWGLNNIMESNNYCSGLTGIDNESYFSNLTMNYNNSEQSINVANASGKVTLKLFDIMGKMVKQNSFDVGTFKVDIGDLDIGVYVVSIFTEGDLTRKLKIFKN